MSSTDPTVTLEPVTSVSANAEVCHFDELDEKIAHRLPELAPGDSETDRAIADPTIADTFEKCECDVIKFTRFYRIDIR